MKNIVAVLALVSATPVVAKDQVPVAEPTSHPEWSKVRENAEAVLVDRLVDPESARIKWTKGFVWTSYKSGGGGMLSKKRWGWIACGTLNARNRMGGYNGPEKIVALVMEDGTLKAGPAYSIDGPCSYDDERFGEVVPELQ